jgi:hypothetical protein
VAAAKLFGSVVTLVFWVDPYTLASETRFEALNANDCEKEPEKTD